MLYVRPDYFEEFKCTADKCEATCCAGWQIVIDDEALSRYESESSAYGETLRNRIDWEEGVFKQDCRKRCAFLKEDNLCDMYEQLGEESLCFTCTNYPRHIEEFEELREITLAISCPEVAKIILGQKEPVKFVELEAEGWESASDRIDEFADGFDAVGATGSAGETDEMDETAEIEDFDPFYFSYLEDARKIMLSILQNRDLPVAVRTALVQNMAKEMQEIIEDSDLFDLADVFDRYEEEENLTTLVSEVQQDLNDFYENAEEMFSYDREVFGRLYELEHLSDTWEDYLTQCRSTLYETGAQGYQEILKQFAEYCRHAFFDDVSMEIILEQLLVYFVFTYFCGAVYDDNVTGRIGMSIDSVHIIYQLIAAKWMEQDGNLSAKDIQQIVYRYSRELEHSDLNLERMQE